MKRKSEDLSRPPSTPYEAFRRLAYSYGVEDLARLMGLKTGTLYNKADADAESQAQPTLRDVVMATEASGDYQVLDALEEMFGRVAYNASSLAHVSDEALLELLTKLGKEHGEFHAALHAALIDKKFNREDLRLIKAEAFDLVSALMTLVSRVEGLVDE